MGDPSVFRIWRWAENFKKAFTKLGFASLFKSDNNSRARPTRCELREHCASSSSKSVQAMDTEILDRKIRRLVAKLKRHNIDLEVFEDTTIEFGDMLGKGGEGVVMKCTVVYKGVQVDAAAKTLVDNSEDAISITLDEVELLCLAYDPIINTTLKVYGVASMPHEDDNDLARLVIITEPGLMNSLELFQKEEIASHIKFDLFSRVAAGVYTMHSKKIIHQDLKPENLLVTSVNRDEEGNILKLDFKIIDMGMAKQMYTERIVTDDILGTSGYHPPEVLFEDAYDLRADVFMLGVTFSVLLHSSEFLNSEEVDQFLSKLHKAKKKKLVGHSLFVNTIKPTIEQQLSRPVESMLCSMLEDQENRDIGLLEVADMCRKEADRLRNIQKRDSVSRSATSRRCTDSGFSSQDKVKTRRRVVPRPFGTPQSSPAVPNRKRRRCSSRSSIVSNSSEQAVRWEDRRITRAQTRGQLDNVCSDLTNVVEKLEGHVKTRSKERLDSESVSDNNVHFTDSEEENQPRENIRKRLRLRRR